MGRRMSLSLNHDPVVVVGTTPDYVARIYRNYPQAALFILDPRFKDNPCLTDLDPSILLFAPLDHFEDVLGSLKRHLSINMLSPQGIACFDCDSLIVAGHLAQHLGMPFPSPEAIIHARNKLESRRIWTESGVACPRALIASDFKESQEFFRSVRKHVVLKPVSGSGSELLFHCTDETDIGKSVQILEEQLPRRRSNPLFKPIPGTARAAPLDPCKSWIVEEYVPGPEFSCDFLLQDGDITILRETGKVKAPDQTFGSILAYTFPPSYPGQFTVRDLSPILLKASWALGFTWGHFMVDFIIQNGHPVVLEMTPRPGGDSIPDLVKMATGYDLIGNYLDMVSGRAKNSTILPSLPSESFASIHLYAPREGIISHLDVSQVLSLPWVKGVVLKKNVGDVVKLPPHDYDNRLLGYCIVSVEPSWDMVSVHRTIQQRLRVSVEDSGPSPWELAACLTSQG